MADKPIYYSEKYYDEEYEYRHVVLPKEIAKRVPKTHLMSEAEWRAIGIQMSPGWIHYMIHRPVGKEKWDMILDALQNLFAALSVPNFIFRKWHLAFPEVFVSLISSLIVVYFYFVYQK